MNERDILNLIERDDTMMSTLRTAELLNLKDWIIGAGFVRNKVWNHLHGFTMTDDTADIDLVYFDPEGNTYTEDQLLSEKLSMQTGQTWEIVNEYYAHTWNNLLPFSSTEDAIAHWTETATAIGVTLRNNELTLVAPHGIDDLVHLIIRPTPTFIDRLSFIHERVTKKHWLTKWPKLRLSTELESR